MIRLLIVFILLCQMRYTFQTSVRSPCTYFDIASGNPALNASFLSPDVPWMSTVIYAGMTSLSVAAMPAMTPPSGSALGCRLPELLSCDLWFDVSEEHDDNGDWCLLLLVEVLRIFDDDDTLLAEQVSPVDRTLPCLSFG